MLAKVRSCAIVGLEGVIVEVEVDISSGLPFFGVVGLPDTAVQEARERVRAAVRNSGFTFPMKRVVAGLAPANLKKAGPAYDLPIAVAMLIATQQVPAEADGLILLGELALDGTLRHTPGILPMVAASYEKGFSRIVVPQASAREASLVDGVEILPFANLTQLASYLRKEIPAPAVLPDVGNAEYILPEMTGIDFAYIKGQEHVKRALEIAAAGGHNVIMMGPPGSGKTLLARSLCSILPPMTNEEAIEVTKIYSISGLLPPDMPIIKQRPFRSPHYTTSNVGLVGGGHFPKPGEISLSHRGVLFLDELPEFGHALLEVLRQPLEDKMVSISRAQGSVTYPANFMLVGAMNPCPCGYYSDPFKQCTCSPGVVAKYQKRISGPFLDRVDIFVEVPRIDYEKLADDRLGEKSEKVQVRVTSARERQLERFKGTKLNSNADMTAADVREYCQVEDPAQSLLKAAMKQLNLSARAFHRILKLARTIADHENSDVIKAPHLAEAIQYRPRSLLM
ncbi:MAG: YifB family Mg chelatase-like AAA ATPase [Dehalococcoidales bacterium]|nr:YifB family Mg chelatase-like AAA ATPase [Dehalococcoidales bacterium]